MDMGGNCNKRDLPSVAGAARAGALDTAGAERAGTLDTAGAASTPRPGGGCARADGGPASAWADSGANASSLCGRGGQRPGAARSSGAGGAESADAERASGADGAKSAADGRSAGLLSGAGGGPCPGMADIVDGGPCPGMADIVAVGSPVMDLLVNTQRLPEGEGVSRANDIFHQGGGNASSAMAAAARLGARAGMIAKVGGDAIGRFILKDFEYNGVDTSRVVVGPPGTSSSYCIALSQVELGTRVFVLRDSTAGALAPGEIDYGYIAGAKLLHLEAGGDPASLAAAKFAREHGVAVSVDAGYYSKESEAIIPLADIFIASDIYYSEMFKGSAAGYRENCEALRGMGPSVVWVTLGSRGCVGLAGGEFYEIPSFGVRVADTTGAGDVFHGAYLAAALRGFPHGECARRASAVSAIKCMFVGGRTGLPDAAMLERFLRDGALGAADAAELEKRLAFYRGSFLEA